MQDSFINHPESIAMLYGETLYIIAGQPPHADSAIHVIAKQEPVEEVRNSNEQPLREKEVRDSNEQPMVESPPPPSQPKAGIQWRTKAASRMLFILQHTELKDPNLTDFLKKIVEAVGIPFENAGFGIIQGPVNLREFEQMPNRYGVVFDGDLWMEPNAMTQFGENEVFFTSRLAYLQNDPESKRQLWNYLKNLKEIVR
jgi:hypothetical protein